MQYELAVCDYYRFLSGWGMWGTNSGYAEKRSFDVLEKLCTSWSEKRGKCFSLSDMTEEDWKEAINEMYPPHAF